MADVTTIGRRFPPRALGRRAALALGSAGAAALLTSWSQSRLPLTLRLAELALCVLAWEGSIAACRAGMRHLAPAADGSALALAAAVVAAWPPATALSLAALAALNEPVADPAPLCWQSLALGLVLAFARRGLGVRRNAPGYGGEPTRAATMGAASTEPAPVCPSRAGAAFLRRHAPHLAGGRLLALRSEDHYLRLHTDRGSALVLMRLRDAVSALGPEAGWQTHRSHWIAMGSGAVPKRQGQGWTLVLPDGTIVPVSRANASRLHDPGAAL